MAFLPPLSFSKSQAPNARINRAAQDETSLQVSRMKATLVPLRFNELLGFVRRCHSVSSGHSTLNLSFHIPTAAWRFKTTKP